MYPFFENAIEANLPKIIVALDFSNQDDALGLVAKLHPSLCHLKVGYELFYNCGFQILDKFKASGYKVFLDLKLHDIPNTVAQACKFACEYGVWMLNVHCLGGREMLYTAKETISKYSTPPLLIGVTLLTSINSKQLEDLGINKNLNDEISVLAKLANDSALDGVVCSPQEIKLIKEISKDLLTVSPGIRENNTVNDHKRTLSIKEAFDSGGDYFVIGRPITGSIDPFAALINFSSQIK